MNTFRRTRARAHTLLLLALPALALTSCNRGYGCPTYSLNETLDLCVNWLSTLI